MDKKEPEDSYFNFFSYGLNNHDLLKKQTKILLNNFSELSLKVSKR